MYVHIKKTCIPNRVSLTGSLKQQRLFVLDYNSHNIDWTKMIDPSAKTELNILKAGLRKIPLKTAHCLFGALPKLPCTFWGKTMSFQTWEREDWTHKTKAMVAHDQCDSFHNHWLRIQWEPGGTWSLSSVQVKQSFCIQARISDVLPMWGLI